MEGLIMDNDESLFHMPRNSSCTFFNEAGLNITTPWAPIFAQNRLHDPDNLYVLIPDFSYFSQFRTDNDHGNQEDVWFETVEREARPNNNSSMHSPFRPLEYDHKDFASAVWRGTSNRKLRDWGEWRSALLKCDKQGFVNASKRYLSKAEMCKHFKAIISAPGNGVWSWATKFNMLCNSVTMLPRLELLGGESWETRAALLLREGRHYLGLTTDSHFLCEDVRAKVEWVRGHPVRARRMAYASRKLVLSRLNREAVLRDFAGILIEYAKLFSQHESSSINIPW